MHTYLKDRVATKIFSECRGFVVEFLSLLLKLDKEFLDKNLKMADIRIGQSLQTKNSITDATYMTEDNVYNIEINYKRYKSLDIKNMTYICQLVLKDNIPGKNYDKLKKITQINIDGYDYFNANKFIYISKLMEVKELKVRSDLIQIIDINLNYLVGKDISQLKERLEKLMYIFVCGNMDEIKKISDGDEVMMDIEEKIKQVHADLDCLLFYDPDELYRIGAKQEVREEVIREVREELQDEVRKEVTKQVTDKITQEVTEETLLKMAQKLIDKGMDNKAIEEITGLKLAQIEKLRI